MGEGIQLKQLLEERYSYTDLKKRFELRRSSITRYTGGMLISNQKFIKQMEELFQKPFNQIIKTIEDQLKNYIIEIKDNIKEYNSPTDNKTFDDLYKYAIDYCKPYDLLMAKGNVGLYKYNMGLHYDAENMLKEVVDTSVEKGYKELIVYYSVQLAFVQLGYDLKLARKTLFRPGMIMAEEKIEEEISQRTLFNYYHFYGVVLRRSKKFKEAREIFHKAVEVAPNDTGLAKALSNVGVTYSEEKKYKSAIEWSRRALDKATTNVEIQSGILNNMANYYNQKGEVGKAHYYLALAMKNFHIDFEIGIKVSIYDTYLEFNATNSSKILEVILDVFQKATSVNECQHHLVTCVEKLTEQLKENEDIESMQSLLNSLISYTELTGDKRCLTDLKASAVDIIHYLLREGINVFAF